MTQPFGASRRLLSVDALRGAAVGAMVFFNNTVSPEAVPALLVHARWHGFTVPDGVFPLFLFVVGASIALAGAAHGGESKRTAAIRLLVRTGLLLLIGLGLNLAFYGLPLRYPGILQRIAIAALVAAPFARARSRWPLAAAAVLMLAHTAVLALVPAPGLPPGTLERGSNIAGWIDVAVFGRQHLLGAGFDPEGLLGVLTSSAEALLGLAAGRLLVESARHPFVLSPGGKGSATGTLVRWGIASVVAALVLAPLLPINKRLFTATFVLLSAGLNALLLAAAHQLADVRGYRDPFRSLAVLGRNAILVYVGASLLSTALARLPVPSPLGGMSTPQELMAGAFASLMGPAMGSIAVSSMHALFWLAVANLLDRRNIHLKL